jgi:hypothetical protein
MKKLKYLKTFESLNSGKIEIILKYKNKEVVDIFAYEDKENALDAYKDLALEMGLDYDMDSVTNDAKSIDKLKTALETYLNKTDENLTWHSTPLLD